MDPSLVVRDPVFCLDWNGTNLYFGCVLVKIWCAWLGFVELMTVFGELMFEFFWGFLEDDLWWVVEFVEVSVRGSVDGRDSVYFLQYFSVCDGVDFLFSCKVVIVVGFCDCM